MSSDRRRIKVRPNDTAVPEFVSRARASNGPTEAQRWVALKHSHARLQKLYAISKLLARFGGVDATVGAVAGIVRQTLALRSAIFIRDMGRSRRVLIWHARGADPSALQTAKSSARASYNYFSNAPNAGRSKADAGGHTTEMQTTEGPEQMVAILLPLAVQGGRILGALQVERPERFDESDLIFVNAVVNELAVALERYSIVEERLANADVKRLATIERLLVSRSKRVSIERGLLKQEGVSGTPRRRRQPDVQSAAEGREDLLAIVSHDLKNPLSVILMAISSLENSLDVPNGLAAPPQVQMIKRSAQRMHSLILDLLDTTSARAGNLSIEPRSSVVAGLVGEAIESILPIAASKSIRLSSDLLGDLPRVWADPSRIQQVFSNLLGNAIKFTPHGGAVTVRARPMARVVQFEVVDTGNGIAQAHLPYIFNRFWQAERTTRMGAGLGLSIVQGIVLAHGGQIWAQSEVGAGSTIFFTLPGVVSAV